MPLRLQFIRTATLMKSDIPDKRNENTNFTIRTLGETLGHIFGNFFSQWNIVFEFLHTRISGYLFPFLVHPFIWFLAKYVSNTKVEPINKWFLLLNHCEVHENYACLPFLDPQSQHWSFPGKFWTYLRNKQRQTKIIKRPFTSDVLS